MRRNSITRHGITLFLLLIFFQQIGAGLFIHNLTHGKNESAQSPGKQNEDSKGISFACSCVDDFLMPFTGADEISVLQRPADYTAHTIAYIERNYFTTVFFSSLRGPPSLIG